MLEEKAYKYGMWKNGVQNGRVLLKINVWKETN